MFQQKTVVLGYSNLNVTVQIRYYFWNNQINKKSGFVVTLLESSPRGEEDHLRNFSHIDENSKFMPKERS